MQDKGEGPYLHNFIIASPFYIFNGGSAADVSGEEVAEAEDEEDEGGAEGGAEGEAEGGAEGEGEDEGDKGKRRREKSTWWSLRRW
jgi:hypothetical protein